MASRSPFDSSETTPARLAFLYCDAQCEDKANIRAAIDLLNRHLPRSVEIKQAFAAEFAALCLPKYMIWIADFIGPANLPQGPMLRFGVDVMRTPYFARWLRYSSEQQTLELVTNCLEWFEDWLPQIHGVVLTSRDFLMVQDETYLNFLNMTLILSSLLLNLPPTFDTRTLSTLAPTSVLSNIKPIWRGLYQKIVSSPRLVAQLQTQVGGNIDALGIVRDFLFPEGGDGTPLSVRRKWMEEREKEKEKENIPYGGPMGWFECAGKESRERSGCTSVEEEGDMKACGKCGSVRYCSREHQRSRWKKHKKTCFARTW